MASEVAGGAACGVAWVHPCGDLCGDPSGDPCGAEDTRQGDLQGWKCSAHEDSEESRKLFKGVEF